MKVVSNSCAGGRIADAATRPFVTCRDRPAKFFTSMVNSRFLHTSTMPLVQISEWRSYVRASGWINMLSFPFSGTSTRVWMWGGSWFLSASLVAMPALSSWLSPAGSLIETTGSRGSAGSESRTIWTLVLSVSSTFRSWGRMEMNHLSQKSGPRMQAAANYLHTMNSNIRQYWPSFSSNFVLPIRCIRRSF